MPDLTPNNLKLDNWDDTKPHIQKAVIDGYNVYIINQPYYQGILQLQNDKETLEMKLNLTNLYYKNDYKWSAVKNNIIAVSIGFNVALLAFVVGQSYLWYMTTR